MCSWCQAGEIGTQPPIPPSASSLSSTGAQGGPSHSLKTIHPSHSHLGRLDPHVLSDLPKVNQESSPCLLIVTAVTAKCCCLPELSNRNLSVWLTHKVRYHPTLSSYLPLILMHLLTYVCTATFILGINLDTKRRELCRWNCRCGPKHPILRGGRGWPIQIILWVALLSQWASWYWVMVRGCSVCVVCML